MKVQVHLSLASRVGDKTEARMELEFVFERNRKEKQSEREVEYRLC
jgi:hypothetical protein